MTRWLYSVARRCAEHGWLVIGIWIAIALVIVGANRLIPGASVEEFSLRGTDSTTAQELLGQAFPGASSEAQPVVLTSDTVNFRSAEGERVINDVNEALLAMPSTASTTTPAEQPGLISTDGNTALIQLVVNNQSLGKDQVAYDTLETAQQAAGPEVKVLLGGILGNQLSKPDTHSSEALGLLAALIVLFFTMRRLSAMLLPLITAVLAVGIGLAVVGLLGRIVFIPDVAPTLGTMLGLGVGIDYALFLVTRHRKLLKQGFDVPDAVGRTLGTAGAGMVFAGGTLIAAVCGLTLTGISFLAWLGYAAAVVVAIAVAAALTFVPAMLGVLGPRIMPKNPKYIEDHEDESLDNSWWARLASTVTSKPWTFAISSTVILLLLAAPAATLTLGTSGPNDLPPETMSRQAYDAMAEGFGAGSTAPLAVVSQMYTVATAPKGVTGPGDPRTQDPRLIRLQKALAATPGVVSAGDPIVSTDGGIAIIKVTPEWNASNPQTEELVNTLRTEVIPPVTENQGMASYVGGVTALTNDLYQLIAERTPWFILGVVTLSFILLMLAYRSLLIPFKAACMNLLSIAAAYGVVTVVFQWGWGDSLIGLDGPTPIDSYLPMMMFAVLFGLSMDYEVFLLTAFREHWERTGDMLTSVRRGLADTGRLVTAAALIMVVVFASFILSDNATVKMFGVGLSTAVLVDATIVRCLLVPAIMVLAAKGTWWLPDWLDRLLPKLHVEGDPAALDQLETSTQKDFSKRPVALHRPMLVIATGVGVLIAWALVSRLPTLPPDARTAVALSAVLTGVTILLPIGFAGDRGSRPIRALGFAIGIGIGLVVVGLLTIVVPPVPASNGAVTAWAIVLVSLIAVLVVGRALALPLLLGSIATAVSIGFLGPLQADAQTMIAVTLLPALVTFMVTSVIMGIAGTRFLAGPPEPESRPADPIPADRNQNIPASLGPLLRVDPPKNEGKDES